jgi:hypothetical protein
MMEIHVKLKYALINVVDRDTVIRNLNANVTLVTLGKIVLNSFVKIIVMEEDLAQKDNVIVLLVTKDPIVNTKAVKMTVIKMENVLMENAFVILVTALKIIVKVKLV